MDNNVDNVNNTSTANIITNKATLSSLSSTSVIAPTAAARVSGGGAQNKLIQPKLLTSSNSFWKNSNRIVPGRPSPKRVNTIGVAELGAGGGMMATFRDYQNSVSDAWDMGDDEFCILSNAAMQQQQQQSLQRSTDLALNKSGMSVIHMQVLFCFERIFFSQ